MKSVEKIGMQYYQMICYILMPLVTVSLCCWFCKKRKGKNDQPPTIPPLQPPSAEEKKGSKKGSRRRKREEPPKNDECSHCQRISSGLIIKCHRCRKTESQKSKPSKHERKKRSGKQGKVREEMRQKLKHKHETKKQSVKDRDRRHQKQKSREDDREKAKGKEHKDRDRKQDTAKRTVEPETFEDGTTKLNQAKAAEKHARDRVHHVVKRKGMKGMLSSIRRMKDEKIEEHVDDAERYYFYSERVPDTETEDVPEKASTAYDSSTETDEKFSTDDTEETWSMDGTLGKSESYPSTSDEPERGKQKVSLFYEA